MTLPARHGQTWGLDNPAPGSARGPGCGYPPPARNDGVKMVTLSSKLSDEFMASLVNMANSHEGWNVHDLREYISANDLVFGIWQDHSENYNVGCMIIKGQGT